MSDKSRCALVLCQMPPKGLVRMQVYIRPEDATPSIREVPMCGPCADAVGAEFRRGTPLHLTPNGAVYVGDLDDYLPRRRASA